MIHQGLEGRVSISSQLQPEFIVETLHEQMPLISIFSDIILGIASQLLKCVMILSHS